MQNNFDIRSDYILDVIAQNLETVGAQVSEKTFFEIAERIDETLPGVVEAIAYNSAELYKSEARSVSTGWGKHYARSIRVKSNGDSFVVEADESNKFVNFVESGVRSFDIKKGLLASEKAKTSSDGIKYITIPFPVRTPKKKSNGEPSSRFGGREMSSEIYKIVKSGGKFSGKLPTGQDVQGLSRWRTAQRHEQYGMFLTVSERSNGWQHPGTPAEPVYQRVLDEVNRNVAKALDAFCKSIVKEYL